MPPLPPLGLPPGYTDHGVPGLLCAPSKWSSVLLFYVANYLAHCATVKPFPAETPKEFAVAVFSALFLPSSGISRALDSIVRRPRLRKMTELERACIAGALCMVVRNSSWKPEVGDILRDPLPDVAMEGSNVTMPPAPASALDPPGEHDQDALQLTTQYSEERVGLIEYAARPSHSGPEGTTWSLNVYYTLKCSVAQPPWIADPISTSHVPLAISERLCKIHGIYRLPPGYDFACVPSDAVVEPLNEIEGSSLNPLSYHMSSSYSFTKSAVAIGQTIYASITLFRARGDQITVYGYAAFGLTVIPYIIMSVLNLVAQVLAPDYSALYMVHSEEMEEARRRGGVFDGAVGTLKLDPLQYSINYDRIDIKSSEGMRTTNDVGRRIHPLYWKVIALENEGRDLIFEKHTMATAESGFVTSGRRIAVVVSPGPVEDKRLTSLYIPTCSRFARMRAGKSLPWKSFDVTEPNMYLSQRLIIIAPMVFGVMSIAAVGILTRFNGGKRSTRTERGFTMSWLVVGMFFGVASRGISFFLLGMYDARTMAYGLLIVVIIFGAFLVPALGGFIVVGKMIMEFGSCTRIG